jgi:hypothetical protein
MPSRISTLPLPAQDAEDCPVPDDILGGLYRSPDQSLAAVCDLPEDQKGRLAAFCYGRAHLRDIGLAIAATCELGALVDAAGFAGRVIYAQSRERPEVVVSRAFARRPITLASSAGMAPRFFDQDAEEPELISA